ncbi:hypothetical protein C2S51_004942 [Perilla frutescens var. frutescens]|nr:hypothetical protein C2S51_004942 [Perilla frutescens var. frutescens]
MALQDFTPLVLPFLLITMAMTSGHLVLAEVSNLLQINFSERHLPQQPDPTRPEPELPKVELPDFPSLSDRAQVPTLTIVHLPAFPQLSKHAWLPKIDHNDTFEMKN